ncbi:type I DNA topoisomerase [Timonella sp. A28]|uniref:type I DNA topoisomerase n=1 Tax=Timonella sp. A28 TaxID=3442640 RepID=UPI003EBAC869
MSEGRKLVIVESPAKARTIANYLGEDYEVEASVGHIRDLPQPSELPADMKKGPYGKFAVDVNDGFTPYYEVYSDKKKKVTELKRLLKEADELYLATDEDREGEAIAWHLLEALRPKVPVKRMVFHEITREAIQRALENTRDLDERLVDAQETRRILDRLYGYEVSPVLWRKVRQGLSAGRVQSVATRLVVERERERMAFVPAQYWDISATFTAQQGADAGNQFTAKLTHLDGKRVASGRDFNDAGQLTTKNVVHLDEQGARALVDGLADQPATVQSLETKPYTRRPAAPFTTSTLQQEASRKLRMSSKQTMRVAQGLYENGFITYMRTDSPVLSSQAITAARRQASELYGAEYVSEKPRLYAPKSKGAQEAHEAIRPAGDSFRTPAQVASSLSGDQFKLYELIWKRTVASQMADARGSTASVKIALTDNATSQQAVFSASGTVITFRGFLAAYEEGTDKDRYSDDAQGNDARLPNMTEGDPLAAENLNADGHTTSAPPRYTEASLVKALEERGIGRPSTYAATISTIQDRGYVNNRGQALVPSWLAFAVIRLLEEHFGQLIDYDFTAEMESDLDEIAAGQTDRVAWLTHFYFGDEAQESKGLKELVDTLGEIDARDINTVPIGDGIVLRVGRYGPYVEDLSQPVAEGENPPRASVPDEVAPDELTPHKARELLETQADGDIALGVDPESGREIIAKAGRFGPYVTEVIPEPEFDENMTAAAKKKAKAALPKPRTASLFKSQSLQTVTLEEALKLLSLPRIVGQDPETGTDITAQNGRYGPYLKKGTDSRTLASEEQLLTITLEEALEVYKQPKRGRGATASAPLKELGIDPTSEKPIVIKDGRFGPYVTDGKTNRTLPKDATIESVTFEQAVELLAEKRAKGPVKRTTRASTAKKATTKKTTTKKSTTRTTKKTAE